MLFASNKLQDILTNNAVISALNRLFVHPYAVIFLLHISYIKKKERDYALFFRSVVFICKHLRLRSKCRPAMMFISCLVTQLTIWVLLRLNLMSATQQFEVCVLDGFNKQHCQHPHDTVDIYGWIFLSEGKTDHSGFTWWFSVFCLCVSVAQDSAYIRSTWLDSLKHFQTKPKKTKTNLFNRNFEEWMLLLSICRHTNHTGAEVQLRKKLRNGFRLDSFYQDWQTKVHHAKTLEFSILIHKKQRFKLHYWGSFGAKQQSAACCRNSQMALKIAILKLFLFIHCRYSHSHQKLNINK